MHSEFPKESSHHYGKGTWGFPAMLDSGRISETSLWTMDRKQRNEMKKYGQRITGEQPILQCRLPWTKDRTLSGEENPHKGRLRRTGR